MRLHFGVPSEPSNSGSGVVQLAPGGACAGCGYSRAGMTDPAAPCPECGAVASRLSPDALRELRGGLRLIAWSLGAGIVGWYAASRALTGSSDAATKVYQFPMWVLLVPLVVGSMGLWRSGDALGKPRLARRCVWAGAALAFIMWAMATGADRQLVTTVQQVGLGNLWDWRDRILSWSTSVAVVWLTLMGLRVLRQSASAVGLGGLARGIGRGTLWVVLAMAVPLAASLALFVLITALESAYGNAGTWPAWAPVVSSILRHFISMSESLWTALAMGALAVVVACLARGKGAGGAGAAS